MAYNCPRIAPGFLEGERWAMGWHFFATEYLCEFLDAVDSVFRYDDVMSALRGDVAPLFGNNGQDAMNSTRGHSTADVEPLFATGGRGMTR